MKNVKQLVLGLLLFFPHVLSNVSQDTPSESSSQTYPLIEAIVLNDMPKIEQLCKEAELINQKSPSLATPLHIAVLSGKAEIVSLLLDHHADIAAKAEYDLQPIHFACLKGHTAIVQLLIERGADRTVKNALGKTPLCLATENSRLDTVNYLTSILTPLQINSADMQGYTPLHVAAMVGNIEIVAALLKSGADVHAQGEHDIQPLHFASLKGNLDVVKLLIQYGAVATSAIATGKTALSLAMESSNIDVVHYLLTLHS